MYLKEISVRHNDFHDQTAQAFADSLKEPGCKIEKITMSNNLINDSGGELMAESLRTNRTLSKLDLSWNNMCNSSGKEFSEALKDNFVIKELKIDNNTIALSVVDHIQGLVMRNLLYKQQLEVEQLTFERQKHL